MAFSVPSSDEIFTVPSSEGVQTVASSPQPVTVSSASSHEMAAAAYTVQGGYDVAVSDNSLPDTVEQVDSSSMEQQRSLPSSSSSEDMELLEAQAALAEAKLKLQLARNKKAKRSTTSGTSSAASIGRPPRDVHALRPQPTAPIAQNNDTEHNRSAELPISEDPWWFRMWTPKGTRDPDRRNVGQHPRDLPPHDGHHAPGRRDRVLPPGGPLAMARTMSQPHVDVGAGVGSLHSPDSTASREMQAMRDRITQLEAQLTVTPPSPKDSGFQTPREVPVVNNLIDLDTPPRPHIQKEKIGAYDFREHVTTPPALPGPFGHHHEGHGDAPRMPGEWPPQVLKVESPPGLSNFVVFTHGKPQKTKNDGPDPGPSQPSSSDSPSSASSCNSDSDNDKWIASLKMSAKRKKRRQEKEEESESDPGLPALPARAPAVKVRETDSIKLLPLPLTPQFDAWKIALRSEVVAASGRPRAAFDWIIETENPKTTFEELADCGEFESLDCKLAAALGKIAKGSIGRVLTNATKSTAK